ncbi:hypothetical protein F4808DRAFT_334786 [Astrocystis sublimbata]|nr:hypothetical protein F4808DRAFT_334786 [Astrocystis sublimbata]
MQFTTGALLSLCLAAVSAAPVTTASSPGCRVDLKPTEPQVQNAPAVILYSTLTKWTKTTSQDSFSSNYLDTTNIRQAPYSVFFKANMIPDYQNMDKLHGVLDSWMGTFLVGDAQPAADDFTITGVSCA